MVRRIVIQVEGLKKRYRLGVIGGATLSDELRSGWARLRGQPDPLVALDAADEQRSGEDFWALRGVDFQVEEGEILGIIGRNGAGKSTLLKLLSRITSPTEGRIRMRGRVNSLLEVGTGFNPELTGRENIYLNGTILGMRKAEVDAKLEDIIAFSGIKHHVDTPVKRYSSGMKVRLGFAVAAHLEPEVMIIDEVLAVGDAEFQRKCLGKMKDVSQSGRTVLFVSHNMVSVQSLCTRVIWLQDGKVVMDGPTDEVVRSYLHTYTVQRDHIAWPELERPGKEDLRLCGVELVRRGAPGDLLAVNEEFAVRIDFQNLGVVDEEMNVGINLINEDDVHVFTSTYLDTQRGSGPFLLGPHSVRCVVPADLLNSGDYRVAVNFMKRGKFYFRCEETIAFTIHDARRDGSYFRKHKGVIRPLLRWDRDAVV